jgi:hypothetical protein
MHALDVELPGLVLDAIDETLAGARLSTLETWVRFAHARAQSLHPVLLVAEMELQLRHGRHTTALMTARSLLADGRLETEMRYRVLLIAARAAHAGLLDREALTYYRQAQLDAPSPAKAREARWGELMCTSALELPETLALLDDLAGSAVESDVIDMVRMTDRQLSVGFRFGFVRHLGDSRRVAELVDQVDDPFVRCSFLTMHTWALALGGYYEEALESARHLLDDTLRLRMDLVVPYAYATEAVSLAGLNRHEDAREAIARSRRAARRINDENGLQNAYAIEMRLLLQEGRSSEACATSHLNFRCASEYAR